MKARLIKKREIVENEYFSSSQEAHIFVLNKKLGTFYIFKNSITYTQHKIKRETLLTFVGWRKISESEFKQYCPIAKILGKND